jgi:hypothetical protein
MHRCDLLVRDLACIFSSQMEVAGGGRGDRSSTAVTSTLTSRGGPVRQSSALSGIARGQPRVPE